MGDSFYEYLLKLWLLTGKQHEQYKRMYLESTTALLKRLLVDQRRRMPQGATERVVHVPMQHFNSPWGRYARHIWGGEGVRLRASVYDDELKVQGVWTAAQQMALVEAARRVGSARTC